MNSNDPQTTGLTGDSAQDIHCGASLQGKKVILTGGTTGIGRAIATRLAASGCRLFICGRDPLHLRDALTAIRSQGGDIDGMAVDVSTTIGITSLFDKADAFLGGLDIGIFNVGVGFKGELRDKTHDECRYVVDVNLTSYIGCSLEALKRMTPTGGHLVLVGSMSAQVYDQRASVYVATKAGVRGFAASLRKEANQSGVKVSLIEPGSSGTDLVDETPEEQLRMAEQGLMLRAEDIASSVHFILTQSHRCDIISLQLRPRLQLI